MNDLCRNLAAAALVTIASAATSGAQEKPKPQYSADGIEVNAAHADEPRIPFSTAAASKYLDAGAIAWGRERKCVSCHTNGSYLFIRSALTAELGPPSTEVRQLFTDQLSTLNKMPVPKLRRSGTRPAQVIYIAAGLAQWDKYVSKQSSPQTSQALELMFQLQNEEGTWHSLTCWPPFESSAYHLAHVAAMAVAAAPEWRAQAARTPAADGLNRLRTYLKETPPPHDYARVLQLWSSLRLDGLLNADQQKQAVRLIRDRQRPDGGWSLRTFATPEQWGGGNRAAKLRAEPESEATTSDGHMTGLALIVLQEAGVAADDKTLRDGIRWLRENQRASGRWWTRSLNTDNQHFITYSGTAYALLALGNQQKRDVAKQRDAANAAQ